MKFGNSIIVPQLQRFLLISVDLLLISACRAKIFLPWSGLLDFSMLSIFYYCFVYRRQCHCYLSLTFIFKLGDCIGISTVDAYCLASLFSLLFKTHNNRLVVRVLILFYRLTCDSL